MKPTKAFMAVALAATLFFSCTSDSLSEENLTTIDLPEAPAAKVIEIEILELINAHRISVGLEKLSFHRTVKAVAFTHTDYMIAAEYVSHDNFFLRKNSLIEKASATVVSENVAYAYSSAESVFNAWINSEGHKENIEGDFVYTDISAEVDDRGNWYFTNIFMK